LQNIYNNPTERTMELKTLFLIPLIASVISCASGGSKIKLVQQDTEKKMVKIMTVDPGHFHTQPPSSAVGDFLLFDPYKSGLLTDLL